MSEQQINLYKQAIIDIERATKTKPQPYDYGEAGDAALASIKEIISNLNQELKRNEQPNNR